MGLDEKIELAQAIKFLKDIVDGDPARDINQRIRKEAFYNTYPLATLERFCDQLLNEGYLKITDPGYPEFNLGLRGPGAPTFSLTGKGLEWLDKDKEVKNLPPTEPLAKEAARYGVRQKTMEYWREIKRMKQEKLTHEQIALQLDLSESNFKYHWGKMRDKGYYNDSN